MSLHARLAILLLLGASTALAAARPEPPAVVVVAVVDGLSQERLELQRPWLNGGLARLLDEGTLFTQVRYRHLNATTGPGHASISTGATPRVHGIVGDRWFETGANGAQREQGCAEQSWAPAPGSPPLFYREVRRRDMLFVSAISHQFEAFERTGEHGMWETRPRYGPKGEDVYFDSSDAVHLFNLKHGRDAEPMPSGRMYGPAALRVATLGDVLTARRYTSRVVALSGSAQAAVLLAGRSRSHAAYWFDPGSARFETSLAYDQGDALALGVRKAIGEHDRSLGARNLLERFGPAWRRLPTPEPARPLPRAASDLIELQIPRVGLGFDHDLRSHPDGFQAGLAVSPAVDELVADLALALLADRTAPLGGSTQPDLLLLSFSALHRVAEAYGPESEEALDTLRRLDVQLGRLLAALEAPPVSGRAVVALVADHGFTEIPEARRARSPAQPAGRLVVGGRTPVDAVARLNRLLAEELRLPATVRPILAIQGWSVFYNHGAFPVPRDPDDGEAGMIDACELDALLPLACARLFAEEIERVVPSSQLEESGDAILGAAFASLAPERSPDAFLIPRAGVIVHSDPGRGGGCGSPHDPDVRVPLVLWGSGLPAGRNESAVAPYDLAPTLAELLEVTLPDATGHTLLPLLEPARAAADDPALPPNATVDAPLPLPQKKQR